MDWSNTSSPASRAGESVTTDEAVEAVARPPIEHVVIAMGCITLGLLIAGTSLAVLTLSTVTGNAAAAITPAFGLGIGLPLIVLGRRLQMADLD